jgi:hypothetical protein
MTVRMDIDQLANEAEEAAIRARFGRLSGPAALDLAADCVDTSAAMIDAGKLIAEGDFRVPKGHRGDVSLGREALDYASDLKRLGQTLAAYVKSRRGSVRVTGTPPPKSQEQLEAERQEIRRRFEGEQMRQQGIPAPFTAAEERELAQAQAAERVRERAHRDEVELSRARFNEEQLQQMGLGSPAERAARNEDLARREIASRGEQVSE